MRCIYSKSPCLPSLPPLKHKLTTQLNQLWRSTHLLQSQHISRPFPMGTSSPTTTASLIPGFNSGFGFNSPANTGDLSVLIPTSAALFFAYWVTNFVVPHIISKHLGLDKSDETDKSKSNNPFDDDKIDNR